MYLGWLPESNVLVGSTKLIRFSLTQTYPKIKKKKKVLLVSFHLEGDPAKWFKWYKGTPLNQTWDLLVKAACIRFRPTKFEDLDDAVGFVKMDQCTSIKLNLKGWPIKPTDGVRKLWSAVLLEDWRKQIAFDAKTFRHQTMRIGLARI